MKNDEKKGKKMNIEKSSVICNLTMLTGKLGVVANFEFLSSLGLEDLRLMQDEMIQEYNSLVRV